MSNKVALILVDGMRPDTLPNIPEAQDMMKAASYDLHAQTVFPSVTLPCHMSLFHSVDPDRHGTTTNTYAPQVRPIDGLCEVLHRFGKECAMFYNWEQLRDLTRPDSLDAGIFIAGHKHTYEKANEMVTDAAISYLTKYAPDFSFIYLGWVDEAGHNFGWLTEEYDRALAGSWKDIAKIRQSLPEDWTVIVVADHGGHERSHGTTAEGDMTIPVLLEGPAFEAGKELSQVSIKDIAPTIAALLGAKPAREWEGKSLI